ncbi:MAG: DNA translocase FtsK [Acidimicrobiaceae bacterium]|nr:DNA translocase FtsK [Acidimicrobiaceae bacterium]MYC41421.1 DNA translocase FtsK [Acidimicrobiaceae bacterium]MYG54720.1 DNA translocase FtsK [Acidimicrobiaceae bacterium]MYJ98792.1 DNA translocase FtsK [Acidimicrobiaceae bacterium]
MAEKANSTNSKNSKNDSRRARSGQNKRASAVSRRSVFRVLSGHRSDLWGLGAILLGLLSAASLWFGAAGVVGVAVDDGLAVAVGLIRFVLPLGLVALGVALIRGTGGEGESEWPARVTVGGLMLLVSLSGLLHVGSDRPGINDTVDDLGAAGGVLGMGVGGALHAAAAVTGSVLILGLLGIVGLIVLTGSSAGALGRGFLMIVRPPLNWLKGQVQALFSDLSKPEATETRVEVSDGHEFGAVVDGPGLGADDTGGGDSSVDADEVAGLPQGEVNEVAAEAEPEPKRRRVRRPKLEPGVVTEQKLPLEMSNWTLPPTSLLSRSRKQEIDTIDVAERGKRLQATLSQFGVETTLLEPIVGPTVTRYVLTLGEGVKVTKFESLRKDMAYAMASPDVRILAPIPGRRAIGVEVPNNKREIVTIGDILASKEAKQASHPLEVAIGRDINGRNVVVNIATMPHVLIAGATGSGKSSCLNSLLSSILMRSTPDQVRMILVDPKRVEMGQYDKIPHLLTAPVTDPRKAANALAWAVREMDRRYDLLADVGVRDITGYNQAVDSNTLKPRLGVLDDDGEPVTYSRLPFVLVVVDELADLMMVAARDVEESIARIAQMARAVGIHLVIATQRPSVNVITGVIKANIPSRWAFAVSSLTDSRVILDQAGAERLVGGGDLLMLGTSSSALNRIQGCWVEESEVRAIVGHWRDQAKKLRPDPAVAAESGDADTPAGSVPSPITASGITDSPPLDSITATPAETTEDGDELLSAAMELVVQTQLGSTSMLQRKLRVGFARAGRIMDLLEQQGVVGPSTGSKARDVLISHEEFEERRRTGGSSSTHRADGSNSAEFGTYGTNSDGTDETDDDDPDTDF